MKKNITTKNIDAVLKFLPYFEDDKNHFYDYHDFEKVQKKDGYVLMCPYYIYSKEVITFIETLYNENIVFPFDWGEWQEEAIRYFNNPDLIKSADTLTLRKLLTLHVRKDRFFDGHLALVIDSGHLISILKRLKELRSKIKNK